MLPPQESKDPIIANLGTAVTLMMESIHMLGRERGQVASQRKATFDLEMKIRKLEEEIYSYQESTKSFEVLLKERNEEIKKLKQRKKYERKSSQGNSQAVRDNGTDLLDFNARPIPVSPGQDPVVRRRKKSVENKTMELKE